MKFIKEVSPIKTRCLKDLHAGNIFRFKSTDYVCMKLNLSAEDLSLVCSKINYSINTVTSRLYPLNIKNVSDYKDLEMYVCLNSGEIMLSDKHEVVIPIEAKLTYYDNI